MLQIDCGPIVNLSREDPGFQGEVSQSQAGGGGSAEEVREAVRKAEDQGQRQTVMGQASERVRASRSLRSFCHCSLTSSAWRRSCSRRASTSGEHCAYRLLWSCREALSSMVLALMSSPSQIWVCANWRVFSEVVRRIWKWEAARGSTVAIGINNDHNRIIGRLKPTTDTRENIHRPTPKSAPAAQPLPRTAAVPAVSLRGVGRAANGQEIKMLQKVGGAGKENQSIDVNFVLVEQLLHLGGELLDGGDEAGGLVGGHVELPQLPAVLQVVQQRPHHPPRVAQLRTDREYDRVQLLTLQRLRQSQDLLHPRLQTLLQASHVDLEEGQRHEGPHFHGLLQVDCPRTSYLLSFGSFLHYLLAVVEGGGVDDVAGVVLHLGGDVGQHQQLAGEFVDLPIGDRHLALLDVHARLRPGLTPARHRLHVLLPQDHHLPRRLLLRPQHLETSIAHVAALPPRARRLKCDYLLFGGVIAGGGGRGQLAGVGGPVLILLVTVAALVGPLVAVVVIAGVLVGPSVFVLVIAGLIGTVIVVSRVVLATVVGLVVLLDELPVPSRGGLLWSLSVVEVSVATAIGVVAASSSSPASVSVSIAPVVAAATVAAFTAYLLALLKVALLLEPSLDVLPLSVAPVPSLRYFLPIKPSLPHPSVSALFGSLCLVVFQRP